MTVHRWFIPEVDDPSDITGQERAFASALSEATAALARPGEHVHDLLIPAAYADHGQDTLVAGLGISDWLAERPIIDLLDFGVHFSGRRVRGGRLHNQLYHLSGKTPSLSLDSRGGIDRLAGKTAAWFEAVLRRPVVLHAWMHEGRAYAGRYEFADTHETLAQAYTRSAAPHGQYERVIAEGHVHGRGWLQTAGLPAPDFYTPVRGDMEHAQIPDGASLSEARGLVANSHWYE
jgi:hypothetical protein